MIIHTEARNSDPKKDIQEASLEIEQSVTELKQQITHGLEEAHHYLEMIHHPFILLGSALRLGIFIGERIGSALESKDRSQARAPGPY